MRVIRVVCICIILLLFVAAAYGIDGNGALQQARLFDKSGDLDKAASICLDIISNAPGMPYEPQARMLLGYILIKKGGPSSGPIEQFLAVANNFASIPDAKTALLRVGYLRDRDDAVSVEWEQLAERYPQSKEAGEALLRLGYQALRKRNWDQAISRFKQCAATDGAASDIKQWAMIEPGFAYISKFWQTADYEYLEQASSHFESMKPKITYPELSARLRLGLGEIYLKMGPRNRAMDEYKAVIAMNPQSALLKSVAEFEIGCVHFSQQQYSKAEAAYKGFLDSLSGNTLQEKNQRLLDEAQPKYSRLKILNPEKAEQVIGNDLVPLAAYWQARSLYQLKRYEEAGAIAEEVAAGFPNMKLAEKAKSLITQSYNARGIK